MIVFKGMSSIGFPLSSRQRSERCSSQANLWPQIHHMRGSKDQWPNNNPGFVQTEVILHHVLLMKTDISHL
ncbi:hypothetical protein TNCV_1140621 [Trichonephila clavipes]|nr:hypothetical protein TNCV_1140621 [Trichonephila clavipes]